jgi:hypothetical protein
MDGGDRMCDTRSTTRESSMAPLKIDFQKALLGLPPVCAVCGQPSGDTTKRFEVREFVRWEGPRTRVMAVYHVKLPVCPRHRGHWSNNSLLGLLVVVIGLALWGGVAILSFSLAPEKGAGRVLVGVGGGLCGGITLAFAWIIVGLSYVAAMRIGVFLVPENQLLISHACPAFVDACRSMFGSEPERPLGA